MIYWYKGGDLVLKHHGKFSMSARVDRYVGTHFVCLILVPKHQVPWTRHSRKSRNTADRCTITFRDFNPQGPVRHEFQTFNSAGSTTCFDIPTYEFPSEEECVYFQSLARQRQLVKTFDIEDIENENGRLAHAQQLKVWRRPTEGDDEITFSFFVHFDETQKHYEYHVDWFETNATMQNPQKLLWELNTKKSVEKVERAATDLKKQRRRSSRGTNMFDIWLHKRDTPRSLSFPRDIPIHNRKLVASNVFPKGGRLLIKFTNPGELICAASSSPPNTYLHTNRRRNFCPCVPRSRSSASNSVCLPLRSENTPQPHLADPNSSAAAAINSPFSWDNSRNKVFGYNVVPSQLVFDRIIEPQQPWTGGICSIFIATTFFNTVLRKAWSA